MTIRLGLTGSIGMGKSTTADMFRDLGVPVWDADATVHDLYRAGGAAVACIADLVPSAIEADAVDRTKLKAALAADPSLLSKIEACVHPLVAEDRARFIADHEATPLILLDIPLLYETGGQADLDAVVVVSTDAETQRARVLARPGMTEAHLDEILSRQMADAEKRRRADHVIETNTLEDTRQAVADLMDRLSEPNT